MRDNRLSSTKFNILLPLWHFSIDRHERAAKKSLENYKTYKMSH